MGNVICAERYLLRPAGGVDPGQAGGAQEATVVQAQTDEVGGAVGGSAHQDTADGQKVVDLEEGKMWDQDPQAGGRSKDRPGVDSFTGF